MIASRQMPLEALFQRDETAWLEVMSKLAESGRFDEIDWPNLSEYLSDMAKRDRREVFNRLTTLLAHLLKWELQVDRRSSSWRGTIFEQRRELRKLLESGTLWNHAEAVIAEAFADARKQAAVETELPPDTFPAECPWPLDRVLADD